MSKALLEKLADFDISNVSSKTLGSETTLFFKAKVSIPMEILQNTFPKSDIRVDDIADILKNSALKDSGIPAYQYTIKYTQI